VAAGALLRHKSHHRPDVRVLILNLGGDPPPELPSDAAKGSIEHIQQKVGVLLVNTHRRRKSDRLTVQAAFAKQQSHVATAFQHVRAFTRRWFFRCAVFRQLNSQEQAFAAHVTNNIVPCLQALEPRKDVIPDFQGV
jgi:hypothetical protein